MMDSRSISNSRSKENDGGARLAFGLLAAYFIAQVIQRTLVSGNVQLDESQQLLWSQEFHLGYGSHPPLYTWMLMLLFQIFGINIFTLALLKNLFLCCTYLLVYGCVKKITGARRDAIAAMSALLLLPQIAWESQRDQSHSVLATLAAAATLLVFLNLRDKQNPARYALLGLSMTVGCLGKYSYGLFPLSLFFAALTVKEFRHVILNGWIFLSLGICAALLAPHAFWARTHPDIFWEESGKLHFSETVNLAHAYGAGLTSLALAVLAFSGPAVLVFAVLYFRPSLSKPAESVEITHARRLITRTVLIGLAVCVVLIFCCRARFKDRWMQQLLFVTPICLVLIARRWRAVPNWKWLFWLNGIIAVGILVILPGSIALGFASGSTNELNRPYADLARQIQQHGFTRGVICTPNRTLAGNLKIHFKESKAIEPEIAWFNAPRGEPWLIAWNVSSSNQTNMDFDVTDLVLKLRGDHLANIQPTVIEANATRPNTKAAKLAFVILPPR